MADQVEPGAPRSYHPGMEARVAVLEHIAQTTAAALERLERSIERMESRINRLESRIDAVAADQRSDFRWLLGIMLGGFAGLLGVMAHGFHWL